MARIVRDPEIFGGKPIIEGTRVSVELILELLGAGLSIDQIREQYPHLSTEGIVACLAYARQRVEEEHHLPAAE